jgi:hypothetical protein
MGVRIHEPGLCNNILFPLVIPVGEGRQGSALVFQHGS